MSNDVRSPDPVQPSGPNGATPGPFPSGDAEADALLKRADQLNGKTPPVGKPSVEAPATEESAGSGEVVTESPSVTANAQPEAKSVPDHQGPHDLLRKKRTG